MSDVRRITCINCPLGCTLEVELKENEVISVTGFQCPRGKDYAKKEVLNPTRTITSIIPVVHGDQSMVSVKTDQDIPKGKIREVMYALKDLTVEAPVEIGQIILANVGETDVNIIATKRVGRK
jgi:CxxC motif-containing protein